jgi:hypothetical protein
MSGPILRRLVDAYVTRRRITWRTSAPGTCSWRIAAEVMLHEDASDGFSYSLQIDQITFK